jgi:Flp pilus assembly protein TadD
VAILYSLQADLFLSRKNDVVTAESLYRKAIEEDPNFIPPFYSLARILLSNNKPEEAILQYQEILKKDPKQAGPHMMIGIIYETGEQFDMAEKHYREALNLNPRFAFAANNLAYILATKSENLQEAMEYANLAKELLPDDPNVMDTLGWIYYRQGLFDFALEELRGASEKLQDNPIVHYHLGMAYYKKGQLENARQALEKAFSLSEDFEGSQEAREILY